MLSTTTNSTFWLGFRDALPFTLVVFPFAVLFGVVAIEAGLQVSQAIAFSLVVVAGAAQFAALQQMVEQAPLVIVILTGYASIATAVEAIKLGAVHYLAKPADADEILASLHKDEGDASVPVSENPLTVKRLEWEHLQKVLSECDGNISAAARKLRMHRRTLQRKLAKRPTKN